MNSIWVSHAGEVSNSWILQPPLPRCTLAGGWNYKMQETQTASYQKHQMCGQSGGEGLLNRGWSWCLRPFTYMEYLEEAPGSWLRVRSALAVLAALGMNHQMENLSLQTLHRGAGAADSAHFWLQLRDFKVEKLQGRPCRGRRREP